MATSPKWPSGHLTDVIVSGFVAMRYRPGPDPPGESALEDVSGPPYNDAMSPDEKLAAILAAVQTDPGNRGLARDSDDNLFTACPGDFAAACRSIVNPTEPAIDVDTGFYIPTAEPPAYETDG